MGEGNKNLSKAKTVKYDEFYTQLTDIEKELRYYKSYFKNKVILCNCDDPRVSSFFKYFSLNFEFLGLKRLICTCYKNQNIDLFSQHKAEKAVYTIYEGDKNQNKQVDKEEIEVHELKGDGDFRSQECIDLLKQADIVCTNPPFSLFREYIAQLIKYDKKFIIIGNQNVITNKEIFPLIKDNKIWLGCGDCVRWFIAPETTDKKFKLDKNGNKLVEGARSRWFTNLDHDRRHEDIILFKKYNPEDYPTYDNYNAIEVSKVKNIPMDYEGVMGVPLTFMDKYNPEQFEIIWQASGNTRACCPPEILKSLGYKAHKEDRGGCGIVYGKRMYSRILIRKKK